MKWQEELQHSVQSISDLAEHINLDPRERSFIKSAADHHPMSITRYYLSLINWDDPDDPIRKIAIPSRMELDLHGQYDTSGESDNTKILGLQHKYSETALLLSTNQCPVYCRHCFRKRMVGMSNSEVLARLYDVLDYVRGEEQITNVLITGGDPFLMSNDIIAEYLDNLTRIGHLKYIRFGTRIPVTFPQRILWDPDLVKTIKKFDKRKAIYITTHFNHPREITKDSIEALQMLGLTANNQTVLLRGVNDNADTMVELMNGLVSIGVIPYYVFQCRPTMRVKRNFQIPLYDGLKIIEETRSRLGGYAKRFRYIMSTPEGKIEILGFSEDFFLFRYHQAKNEADINRIFKKGIDLKASWIDEL